MRIHGIVNRNYCINTIVKALKYVGNDFSIFFTAKIQLDF